MKYSIKYYRDFRYFDIVDEVILYFNDNNENIVEFVKEKYDENKKIVVDITTIEDKKGTLPILLMLQKEHPNMAVRTTTDFYKPLCGKLPFFFMDYCNRPDQVYTYIGRGVSEVYITEGLGFNIKKIGEYCHIHDVEVRVLPNIAQHTKGFGKEIPDECKFFIRPEDVEIYEEYVDTMEIVGGGNRLSALFEIYRGGQWLGDFKDLILGFESSMPNTGVAPYFGKERLKCQHKCMWGECTLCPQMKKIAEMMKVSEYEIRKDRDREFKINKEAINNEHSTDTDGSERVPNQ